MSSPVDLTDLSLREARERVGELLFMLLQKDRVAILVQREDGILTTVGPTFLSSEDPVALAVFLLGAGWSENQVEDFLEHLDTLRV